MIGYKDCATVVEVLKTRAIAVAISTEGLQFYTSGTYNGQGQLTHGVTLVGYSPTQGYRIKNSWGNVWGELGYAWIHPNAGLCDYAMYPVIGN